MTFEFAKYTEITDYAFKVNPDYRNENYIRFFICPDVNDFWLVRILKGYNEEYEHNEDCYLMERDKIAMDKKGESLTLSKLKRIIENDDRSNWDIQQSYDLTELIEMLDGGFGILNLQS